MTSARQAPLKNLVSEIKKQVVGVERRIKKSSSCLLPKISDQDAKGKWRHQTFQISEMKQALN